MPGNAGNSVDVHDEDAGGGNFAEASLRRANTIKPLPLPLSIAEWTAADVLRWLVINNLGVFKKSLYRNGVTGTELLMMDGSSFPRRLFTETDCAAFDMAIRSAKNRSPENLRTLG